MAAKVTVNSGQADLCYYVDWLRVLGIIVVFIFHNTRFFDLIDWEVKNKEVLLGPTIFLGAGKAFLNFGNTWLNRLNEAVMPFYMLHQTIILIVGFQVIQWPVGIPLKYSVISSTSLAVVVGIYYVLIMRFKVTAVILYEACKKARHALSGRTMINVYKK
ncbi:hypothetical protein [Sporomusa malonica]|nr:hypothetical protein [Sporomusa malonica]